MTRRPAIVRRVVREPDAPDPHRQRLYERTWDALLERLAVPEAGRPASDSLGGEGCDAGARSSGVK